MKSKQIMVFGTLFGMFLSGPTVAGGLSLPTGSPGAGDRMVGEYMSHEAERRNLQREVELLDLKAKRAKAYREMVETGVVDTSGDLIGAPELIKKREREAESTAELPPSNAVPEATQTTATLPNVGLPELRQVHSDVAYLSFANGDQVQAQAGDRIPGGYVVREVSLGKVVLSKDGIKYVRSIAWANAAENGSTREDGSAVRGSRSMMPPVR